METHGAGEYAPLALSREDAESGEVWAPLFVSDAQALSTSQKFSSEAALRYTVASYSYHTHSSCRRAFTAEAEAVAAEIRKVFLEYIRESWPRKSGGFRL